MRRMRHVKSLTALGLSVALIASDEYACAREACARDACARDACAREACAREACAREACARDARVRACACVRVGKREEFTCRMRWFILSATKRKLRSVRLPNKARRTEGLKKGRRRSIGWAPAILCSTMRAGRHWRRAPPHRSATTAIDEAHARVRTSRERRGRGPTRREGHRGTRGRSW